MIWLVVLDVCGLVLAAVAFVLALRAYRMASRPQVPPMSPELYEEAYNLAQEAGYRNMRITPEEYRKLHQRIMGPPPEGPARGEPL